MDGQVDTPLGRVRVTAFEECGPLYGQRKKNLRGGLPRVTAAKGVVRGSKGCTDPYNL